MTKHRRPKAASAPSAPARTPPQCDAVLLEVLLQRGWEEVAAAVAEERRLAFVAITRAKRRLFVSCAHRRLVWGTTRPAQPSRFLLDMLPGPEAIGADDADAWIEWVDVSHDEQSGQWIEYSLR